MRCRFTWVSQMRGRVQCWHPVGHGNRHEAWSSRKERRQWPRGSSWVAVGSEDWDGLDGRWLDE